METSIIIETIVKVVIVLAVFSALAGFTTPANALWPPEMELGRPPANIP